MKPSHLLTLCLIWVVLPANALSPAPDTCVDERPGISAVSHTPRKLSFWTIRKMTKALRAQEGKNDSDARVARNLVLGSLACGVAGLALVFLTSFFLLGLLFFCVGAVLAMMGLIRNRKSFYPSRSTKYLGIAGIVLNGAVLLAIAAAALWALAILLGWL